MCYRCIKCKQSSSLKVPSDIAHFLDTKGLPVVTEIPEETAEDDEGSEDVPLLQLEDVNDHEGGWPIYLGMLNRKDTLKWHYSSVLSSNQSQHPSLRH